MARHNDRGYAGEQDMGFWLGQDGWWFVDGPSGSSKDGHRGNAPGFDGVAFHPTRLEMLIADNKAFARSGNVSSASALTTHLKKNVDALYDKVFAENAMPMRILILGALINVQKHLANEMHPWPANVSLVVTNLGGSSTGVTAALKARGITFIDANKAPSTKPAVTQATTGVARGGAADGSGPNTKGDAKFQAAELVLNGVTKVLNYLVEREQARLFNEAWAKMRPGVEATIKDDPSLGALVMVYYSVDSHTQNSLFRDIAVAYGYTRADAKNAYAAQAHAEPVSSTDRVDDSIWYEPQQTVDVRKLPTPWTVHHVATFLPGKEKLTRCTFSIAKGFDEKMVSKDVLSTKKVKNFRFLILSTPMTLTYWSGGQYSTKELGTKISNEPDISGAYGLGTYGGVLALELDSAINPWDAVVVPVYPADNATANAFATTSKLDHGGLLNHLQGIDRVRFVKPEFIKIIRGFQDAWD